MKESENSMTVIGREYAGADRLVMPQREDSIEDWIQYLVPRVESCWRLRDEEAIGARDIEVRRCLHTEWTRRFQALWETSLRYEHSEISFWLYEAYLLGSWLDRDLRSAVTVMENLFAIGPPTESGYSQQASWRLDALKVEARAVVAHLSQKRVDTQYFDAAYKSLRSAMWEAESIEDGFHSSLLRRVARLLVFWRLTRISIQNEPFIDENRKCESNVSPTILVISEDEIHLYRYDWEYDDWETRSYESSSETQVLQPK